MDFEALIHPCVPPLGFATPQLPTLLDERSMVEKELSSAIPSSPSLALLKVVARTHGADI
jgi:hypothetical protein